MGSGIPKSRTSNWGKAYFQYLYNGEPLFGRVGNEIVTENEMVKQPDAK
ncbi:MAG: hypothetical protein KF890_04060 [Nitrospira sp.]|nr:hypothetical protein [Nitrospira sp.]